jgi:hypothetical protein
MDPNPYSAPQAAHAPSIAGAVPHGAVEALARTRGWVTFLAVLFFIVIGLFALGGVGLIVAAILGQSAGVGGPEMLIALPLLLIVAVFYLFPALALNRYSRSIRDLVANPQPAQLEAAVDAHQRIWKLFGILTIVFIGLYFVAIFIAVAVAFVFASAM